MNENEVIERVRAARDAQLRTADRVAAGMPAAPPRARTGVLRPVAVAAAVAGLVAAAALAVPAARHHDPAVGAGAPGTSTTATPAKRSATCDGTSPRPGRTRLPGGAPGTGLPPWNYPSFYPTLSRDPAEMARQLRRAAIQEESYRTRPGGDFTQGAGTLSYHNLAYLEVNYLRGFLTDAAFPVELEATVRQVLVTLSRVPANQVEVVAGARTGGGCTGTGFTSANDAGRRLPLVIFDADGNFLGTAGD